MILDLVFIKIKLIFIMKMKKRLFNKISKLSRYSIFFSCALAFFPVIKMTHIKDFYDEMMYKYSRKNCKNNDGYKCGAHLYSDHYKLYKSVYFEMKNKKQD